MRVSRWLSSICEQRATAKGFTFRLAGVSGWLVRYGWWAPIVKRARGRDPVCRAATVEVSRLICMSLCILLQGLRR